MLDQLKVMGIGPLSSPLFRWYRVYPDGVRVIQIWPSRTAFNPYLEGTLEPLVEDLGPPEPQLSCHDIPRVAHSSGSPLHSVGQTACVEPDRLNGGGSAAG
jgi:hypothetical protein